MCGCNTRRCLCALLGHGQVEDTAVVCRNQQSYCTYDIFRLKVSTCSPEFSAQDANEVRVNISDMGCWFYCARHVSAKDVPMYT